jgi:hypothetical protein
MSTKLQTALCMTTVSMEVPGSGKFVLKFQKPPDFLAHPVFLL